MEKSERSFVFAEYFKEVRNVENKLKKRGRPREEGARRNNVSIRLSESELDFLDDTARKYETSRADIIHKSIEMYIAEMRKSNNITDDDWYDYGYLDEFGDADEE